MLRVASYCPSIAVLTVDIQLASTLPGWVETKSNLHLLLMHEQDLLSAMSCSPNSDCVLRVASSCPSIAVLTVDIQLASTLPRWVETKSNLHLLLMHEQDLLSAKSCHPYSDCVLRVASSCPSIAVLTGDIQLASTLPGWVETKGSLHLLLMHEQGF
jgi:TusA-related sulfurtransferase